MRKEGRRISFDRSDTRLEVFLRKRIVSLSQVSVCHKPVGLCVSKCISGFPQGSEGFRGRSEESRFETLEGLIGRLALVDETTEQMREVNVERMDEGARFIPEDYSLLFGKRSTHPKLVAIGDENETAEAKNGFSLW